MNTSITLFLEFIKIGFFAIGGGYATLPFLYQLSKVYHWFRPQDLTQMLAFASLMPGPIGINLASQVGFKVQYLWGAILAVTGIMIPSLVFVFIISKILKEFKDSVFVKSIFYMLKPACCGMVVAIGFKLLKSVVVPTGAIVSFDWTALAIFLLLLFVSIKQKHDPIFYLGVAAALGLLVQVVKPFIFG
jgi:chromate transporter